MDGEGDDTSLPADSFEDSDDSETDLTQTHGRNVADILGLRDLCVCVYADIFFDP